MSSVIVYVPRDASAVALGADAVAAQQSGKLLRIDVIALQRVVQIRMPVNVDRAGDVSRVIEQHIFVAFYQADVGVVQVSGHPIGVH